MKTFYIILAICLVVLITGCSANTTKLSEPTNAAISSDRITNHTWDTEDEYNAFVAENHGKLPEGFITWEQVRTFGDINCMVIAYDFKYYQYSITDESGTQIDFEVRHQSQTDQLAAVNYTSTMLAQGSLRRITNTTGKAMVVSRNDMEYTYAITGELLSISWYQNGVKTTIAGHTYEYPENRTDTLVGKLLSADDSVANAAFAEIKQNLSE